MQHVWIVVMRLSFPLTAESSAVKMYLHGAAETNPAITPSPNFQAGRRKNQLNLSQLRSDRNITCSDCVRVPAQPVCAELPIMKPVISHIAR